MNKYVLRNLQEKENTTIVFCIIGKKKSKLYTIHIRMLSRLIISIAFLFSLWFSQKEKGKMNNDQKRKMYVQVQWWYYIVHIVLVVICTVFTT